MFRPGQKVVCVNAGTFTELVQGKSYTVDKVHDGAVWVKCPARMGFYAWRFAALVKPVPDVSDTLFGTFPFLNPGKGRV